MNAIHITLCRHAAGWCAALALIALACSGTEPTPPTTGGVRVTTVTAGADLDPDGYTAALDYDSTGAALPIAINGSVTFTPLSPGTHSLTLRGTTANCLVAGANSQTVSVVAGQTAEVTFHVTCVRRVALAGVWNYVEQIGNPLVCNDTGTYVFTQSDDAVGGTNDQVGTCDQQDGAIDNTATGTVSGNLVYTASGGVSVNFSVGGCSYSAAAAGTPPDHLINGAVSCSSDNGSWGAVRGGGAIASVTVSPPARTVVASGTAQLRAVLIDASGSRRVGPTVTWTSDASAVATVDASGLVVGSAPGSATITATAESQSGTAAISVETVTFATVQAGAYHSCGLTANGAAYCWGNGTYGQRGDGTKASGLAPVAVGGGLTLSAISAGAIHTCGLTAGGTAYCWGLDYYGELGAGAPASQRCGNAGAECSVTPLAVAGGRAFSSVSAGWALSCALTSSGAAFCWGDNGYGELGNGSTVSTRTPMAVGGGLSFVSIGTGNFFACGLTAAGAAYCWGNNSAGQLGIGPVSPNVCSAEPCSAAPVAVSGGLTFTALSVGYWHACGLTSSGAAYCWGDNDGGQLGATTTETCAGLGSVVACSRLPLPLEGGVTLAQASAGSFHSCGFTSGGDGYCWGSNSNGQLGNGTTVYGPTPTAMAGGLSFSALTAFGRWHSCGLTTTGVAYCWGYGLWGQLGNGGTFDATVPMLVLGQAAAPGPAPLRASTGARRLARSARRPLSLRPPSP